MINEINEMLNAVKESQKKIEQALTIEKEKI